MIKQGYDATQFLGLMEINDEESLTYKLKVIFHILRV